MSFATATILSEGEPIDPGYDLISIDTRREVNRIPSARLVLVDGDSASRRFSISDSQYFEPGKQIEIRMRGEDATVDTTVFKGLVMCHGVEADREDSRLWVELKHAAVKLTQVRKGKVFLKVTDTEVIKSIIEAGGLRTGRLTSTAPQHPEIVQFYCTDWDFILSRADANGLLVLTQLHPIAVIFTLPADSLASVAQHMRNGALQVDAYSRDDQTKLATGKLLTIDNQVDPTTGTGKLKGIFENTEQALWPNQFVNCHLLLETRKNSTVVPAAAIQRGPQGTYVFTMKPDKTVDMRYITISLTAGNFAEVTKGLSPGEIVVTDGQDKLQTGSHVEPRAGSGPPGQKTEHAAESVQ